jgi:hypothetical protein
MISAHGRRHNPAKFGKLAHFAIRSDCGRQNCIPAGNLAESQLVPAIRLFCDKVTSEQALRAVRKLRVQLDEPREFRFRFADAKVGKGCHIRLKDDERGNELKVSRQSNGLGFVTRE